MTTMPVSGVTPFPGLEGGDAADLVVRNAKVHTGDPEQPAATALAVRHGRITALGDEATVARHVGPRTRVVDALGRRIVPGLNDSHLHVIRGGLNYVPELRWDGVPSLRQALAMLREQAGRTPKGQWTRVVGGWTAEQFAERWMPTVAELNAAAPDTPVFVLHLYQSALMNRAAVRAAGYTRDTPDPRGGGTGRRPPALPAGTQPVRPHLRRRRGRRVPELPGELPHRHRAGPGRRALPADRLPPLPADRRGGGRLRELLRTPARTRRRLRGRVREGGPAAHGERLGLAIGVQNRMSFQGKAFVDRYGAEAAERTPPVTEMLERGLRVAAGTDATRVSSCNPWVALHWLVTGRTVGDLRLYPPDRLVSRENALELYTRGGARMTGEDEVKGLLRTGFLADFAVLSHDYFAVRADDIPHIESVLTVVGGRLVYAAAEYEGLDEAVPPVSPSWSPVARFGGYQATPPPGITGARQADRLAEAVAESERHRRWRAARGSAPENDPQVFDPCFVL